MCHTHSWPQHQACLSVLTFGQPLLPVETYLDVSGTEQNEQGKKQIYKNDNM